MKSLTRGKMWCYAIGQLGWSIVSGLIGSWLVYFYQPNQEAIQDGMISLIPQGRVVLGLLTFVGLITAIGRIFDAVTDQDAVDIIVLDVVCETGVVVAQIQNVDPGEMRKKKN